MEESKWAFWPTKYIKQTLTDIKEETDKRVGDFNTPVTSRDRSPRQTLNDTVVAQSCLTLCEPMDCSTPGLPVHHQLPEFIQTHVHWVSDAIQPSHPLSSPSPAFNLSQHQGLFRWVSSPHQVAKVLEFQLQHESFQWIFSTDFP